MSPEVADRGQATSMTVAGGYNNFEAQVACHDEVAASNLDAVDVAAVHLTLWLLLSVKSVYVTVSLFYFFDLNRC